MQAFSLGPTNRQLHVAVREPPDLQRLLRVGDRFVAHILPRTVVDLASGLLDDAHDGHDPAAGLELLAHQADALEVEAMALARRQQAALAEVAVVADADPERRQLEVLAALRLLVERDVDVEVLLVRDEVEVARKESADLH